MDRTGFDALARRRLLAGLAAAGLAALAGGVGARAQNMAQTPAGDPVRKLLKLAVANAFARLDTPDGFWASPVSRVPLPPLFTRRARGGGKLADPDFRAELQRRLNRYAEAGAKRARPKLEDGVRRLSVPYPAAILRGGGPTAATSALREAMGPALVNTMIPALGRALRHANDPVLSAAIRSLKGVGIGDVAHALANVTDNAIWYAIGASEAAIRRDPASTDDAGLIAALAG